MAFKVAFGVLFEFGTIVRFVVLKEVKQYDISMSHDVVFMSIALG